MNTPPFATLPSPLAVHTRFLVPFELTYGAVPSSPDPFSIEQMVARFKEEKFDGKQVWKQASLDGEPKDIPGSYRIGFLDPPLRFLFGKSGTRACRYLRVEQAVCTRILKNGMQCLLPVRGAREEGANDDLVAAMPRTISPEVAIELWLLPNGLGVLAISLAFKGSESHPLSCAEVGALNYFLSQGPRRRPAALRLKPRPDDPAELSGVPSEEMASTGSAADHPSAQKSSKHDEPWKTGVRPYVPEVLREFMRERLSRPGGEFTLDQLRGWLLLPAAKDGRLASLQDQFSVFTTVLFDTAVTFSPESCGGTMAQFLSALAQIEESGHPGSPTGEVTVPAVVLSVKHWAAAGCMGGAHLVANQGIPFDDERVMTVQGRYFIPWLMAWMQDLVLQHFSRRCSEIAREQLDVAANEQLQVEKGEEQMDHASEVAKTKEKEEANARKLDRLRAEILEFDALCFLNRVSGRAARNRWYRIAQEGFEVEAAFKDVERGVTALDSLCKLHQQQAVGAKLDGNVEAIKTIQGKVEWVELFIIAAYSVYLIHYLGVNFRFHSVYVGLMIPVGGMVAAILAAAALKPWEHDPEDKAESPAVSQIPRSSSPTPVKNDILIRTCRVLKPLVRTRGRFLATVLALFVLYVAAGLALKWGWIPGVPPVTSAGAAH